MFKAFAVILVLWVSSSAQTSGGIIKKQLENRVKEGFSGNVLVAVNDKIILNQGFGFTDSSNKYRVNKKTLFNIASMTKAFTALGILKLKEKALINLDDSLDKYFKNVPEDKCRITIHQLLTHTSGLKQTYATEGISDRETAVEKILSVPTNFESGTDFGYANENFELLAAIIEVVSKKSYESFIREEILQPAGMKNTFFWGEIDDLNARKVGQKIENLPAEIRKRNWGYIGSGGIYSTSANLFKFYLAIKSNKLLVPDSTKAIFQSHRKLSSGIGVGYGFFISQTPGNTPEFWTRGNEDWGHNAVLRWFPDENLVVIVCSNADSKLQNTTANKIISDDIIKTILGF